MIELISLILLAGLIAYTGIRSYQAWRRGKIVVSILLLCIYVYGVMCLWLKLKELL